MKDTLLEVKDLFVEYRTDTRCVKAVNGISLELNAGETLGLVGETGAGKTTTALSIMGLVPNPPGKITAGSIVYDGTELTNCSERQRRKIRGNNIAMIFQDPMTSLNPVISVGEQIMEVYRIHNHASRAEAVEKAKEMLEIVGIPCERYCEYPHQFSGGMKQRVMIAIALACNPKLLIADEPTTALDVTIQAQILDLISNLKRDFNTSVLLITHDLGVVAEVCDKVAVMYAGEIIESGTLRDVFKNTAHPYTKGLFGSLPDLTTKKDRLDAIPGMMPNPANLPDNCKFSPRCQFCTEVCSKNAPPIISLSETHQVRCFRANTDSEGAQDGKDS